MAQLVVRNLDDEVKAKLRRRAEAHGHSMEEEVRAILRDAVKEEARLERRTWNPHCGSFRRHRATGG